VPLRWVLIRDPQGHFATQALRCPDPPVLPAQILAWFVHRWQLAVTFADARRPLGLATQRPWSAAASRRTTPVLRGLFSLVTLLAHWPMPRPVRVVRQAPWDHQRDPPFADTRASVRRAIWQHQAFSPSPGTGESGALPRAVVERLTATLCSVA
jgi:hypothetical protein